jgi:hypothetical protein
LYPVSCILLALFLGHLAIQEIEDRGPDDISDLVCQHIGALVVVMFFVGVEAVVQLPLDVREAEPLAFQALDLLDREEVFQGVPALAALGALRDDDAFQLLFPEAEGVGGNAGALAHFLYGQCLHVFLSREQGARSREQRQVPKMH